ncbi:MAG TPA: hypothetical protein DCS66_25825 [Flavobacteriaceae bacterium]|nr:hypothetical protein [Legionellales bacterium]HAT67978.1 hypothetical protein [Flavobacteriaceae bacterium]|tara:strand:+ start:4720 stop:5697 length:978 start_codon:yes stop_codon:yes gene_type:complete
MSKKWADPLDRLLEADQKAKTVKEYIEASEEQSSQPLSSTYKNNYFASVLEIDPSKIIRWEHKDRPENELGDIESLANTFKSVGQQQPCVVRASKKHKECYELIVGERRWKAAQLAQVNLKAVVQELDDKTAALIQAVENEKRTDLSDYAKGMSYAKKIKDKILTQKDLIEILGISQQQVTRLLSFSRIPKILLDAISDLKLVSARTSEELARLANKNQETLNILIELAPKIRTGKFGANKILKEIERKSANKNNVTSLKIEDDSGRHLFTWRNDNNAIPSIHFPSSIANLLSKNDKDLTKITKEIKELITKKIEETLNNTPRGV